MLAEMVHEAGGADLVREYLRTPGGAMRGALERLLQRPWARIEATWRQRVDQLVASAQ